MKKLTDEIVAKMLGWKRVRPDPAYPRHCWQGPGGAQTLPPLTTSLDAITAEIVRLKIFYAVETVWGGGQTLLYYHAGVAGSMGTDKICPAMALCRALAEHLKFKKVMAK